MMWLKVGSCHEKRLDGYVQKSFLGGLWIFFARGLGFDSEDLAIAVDRGN